MKTKAAAGPLDSYPNLCASVGLSCEKCVSGTARELASVCQSLRGPMLSRMFVQIYPDPACSQMVTYFANCYSKAPSNRRAPAPVEIPTVEAAREQHPAAAAKAMASVA